MYACVCALCAAMHVHTVCIWLWTHTRCCFKSVRSLGANSSHVLSVGFLRDVACGFPRHVSCDCRCMTINRVVRCLQGHLVKYRKGRLRRGKKKSTRTDCTKLKRGESVLLNRLYYMSGPSSNESNCFRCICIMFTVVLKDGDLSEMSIKRYIVSSFSKWHFNRFWIGS